MELKRKCSLIYSFTSLSFYVDKMLKIIKLNTSCLKISSMFGGGGFILDDK